MIRLGGKARGGKVPRKRGGRALRARQHCHGILLCRERTQVVGQRDGDIVRGIDFQKSFHIDKMIPHVRLP